MPRLICWPSARIWIELGDDQVAVALHVDLADEALDSLLRENLCEGRGENQRRKQHPSEIHFKGSSI